MPRAALRWRAAVRSATFGSAPPISAVNLSGTGWSRTGAKCAASLPVALDLRRQRRIGRQRRRDLAAVRLVELAVGEGREFLARHAHTPSPSQASKASRPRTSRELRVPTGQPTIPAASLYE